MKNFEKNALTFMFFIGLGACIGMRQPYAMCIVFAVYAAFLTFRTEPVDEGLLKLEKSVVSYFEKNNQLMAELQAKVNKTQITKVVEKISK